MGFNQEDFNKIDSVGTFPKLGLKIQAILKEDFEVRMVKKMVKGKETEVPVPKLKKGTILSVMKMDLFWMSPEEKGGAGLDIGVMEYLRLTYPDGSPTKYYDLFDYEVKGDNEVISEES